MLTDPEKQKLKVALEQLEIEKQRRIEEKADRGEIVRVPLNRNPDGSLIPVVVGVPRRGDDTRAAYRARKVAELRAAGETREILFEEPGPDEVAMIVTGVPRRGRDDPDDPPVQAHKASKPDTENPRRSEGEALRLSESDSLCATFARPEPEPEPSEPRPIMVQIRAPDERDVAGVIARGVYRYTDNMVRVWDTEGELLGSAPLRPGDDPQAAAKKLLREKCGGTGFYAPISPPRRPIY
jgi:hypothetical protein